MTCDRRRWRTITISFFLILITALIVSRGTTEPIDVIMRDNTVLGPGIGSDGVLINEDIDTVLKRFGRTKFKISKPRNTGELFANVFKVKSSKKIYFELMYYHDENKFALCVFQGKIIALVGFDNNRITTDSVNLRSGVNSFIFYYGNRNLKLLKSDSNCIYMYPDRGMAVVDDGMNDSIDLYIVFAIDNAGKR